MLMKILCEKFSTTFGKLKIKGKEKIKLISINFMIIFRNRGSFVDLII